VIAFSPGLAQGCFDLLGIASRNTLTFDEIHSSFAYFGSIPVSKVVETTQGLRWIRANDDGTVCVTSSGSELLGIVGYEPMLRRALLDYIDVTHPPWLQNASFGRSRVLSFAGSEIAQVFVEAGLAHGTEESVVAFWDELAARARGQKTDRLTFIGRQGERMSLVYEENRTGLKPQWVAIENNSDGYDLLSVVSSDNLLQLSIEVKTSTLGLSGIFHLTRNEWERALDSMKHVFHLWDARSNVVPRLAVVEPQDMQAHIPTDLGSGSWESVAIPFNAFGSLFTPFPRASSSNATSG
jgi:hypothetical protein